MALNRHTQESEGSRSAREINRYATRNWMPQPLLLKPEQPAPRPHPPLRLIKRAEPGPSCGFGTCSLDPECKTNCRYREAAQALRCDSSERHTQRAQMPAIKTEPRNADDTRARRITWAFITAYCIGWMLLAIAWAAFA
jgi:hypothetical protein